MDALLCEGLSPASSDLDRGRFPVWNSQGQGLWSSKADAQPQGLIEAEAAEAGAAAVRSSHEGGR